MKHSVILFDVDGVLISSDTQFTDALEAQHGIALEKLLPFFTGEFGQTSIGKADLKEMLPRYIHEWGWKGSVEELMEFWFTAGTTFDDGALDMVQALSDAGVRCFMASDQEKYRGEHLRATYCGDAGPFEDILFSGEIGVLKRDPLFFDHVLALLGTHISEPSDILFIDDRQANVANAQLFGIDAVYFDGSRGLKEVLQ